MIRFQDLCVDVGDAEQAVAFFGPLLGLRVGRADERVVSLVDGVPEHTLWLNVVPELGPGSSPVKNRVHLDVDVAAVSDVLDLGARVVDDSQRWTVLTSPAAGELCAFVRPPERLGSYRLYEVVVDSVDPEAVATWWAERFGVVPEGEHGAWSVAGAGLPWELVFVPVPEPKTAKNRVHWDVLGDTGELLAAGARLLRRRDDEIGWDVLADPEGNEFCVFAAG